MANRIHHPKYRVKKLYSVMVKGKIPQNFQNRIIKGTKLEDVFFKPDSVKILEKSDFEAKLNLSFHEGNKHLVKRFFSAFNLKVTKLKRIAIGNISLGNLKSGEWRKLTHSDLSKLRKLLGL